MFGVSGTGSSITRAGLVQPFSITSLGLSPNLSQDPIDYLDPEEPPFPEFLVLISFQ